jgi:RNA polymerase sigma-70 factor (ECF subfamily)
MPTAAPSPEVAVPSDEEILAEARAGSEDAFATLVRRHQSMVYGLAFHMLQSAGLAEDLAQDVFLALHQNLARIESASHLQFWLRRVTSNRCIDCVRRPWYRFELPMVSLREPASTPDSNDLLLETLLAQLVGELSAHRRMIVTLRFQEDMDPTDIAAVIDMPVNTVKSHLRRAMLELRRKLAARGHVYES